MGRRKGISKKDIEKFLRLSYSDQARRMYLCFFIMQIFIVAFIFFMFSIDKEIVKSLLLVIIVFFIFSIFILLFAIERTFKAKQQEEYNRLEKERQEKELQEQKKREELYKEKLLNSRIKGCDTMTGIEFELFCQKLFEKKGYNVQLTKTSGDFGADLILLKNYEKIIVQTKRYSNNVSLKAVQEIIAAKSHYNSNQAWVITNSYFTKSAIILAKENNVTLIDRTQLIRLLCEINGDEFNINDIQIPSVQKQEKSTFLPSIVSKEDYGDTYAKKIFNLKDAVVSAYSKSDLEKVKKLIEEAETTPIKNNQDKISLHFFYQDVADIIYAMRYINNSAISDCLSLCDKDIELLKNMDFQDAPSTVKTLTRKAIILEKENKLAEAIAICDFGIDNNYLDNGKPFIIRKSKLENKIKKNNEN